MISRNGVIASSTKHYDGSYLITASGTFKLAEPARTLESLVWHAVNHQLDALWILPGSVESWHAGNGIGDTYFDGMTTSTRAIGVRSYTNESKITCMHAWPLPRPEGCKDLRIFFPEHDERWQLQSVTNPRELLATINMLENGLGVYLDYSPGSTGKYVMKSLNRGSRASWLAPIDFTGTPWLPTDEQVIAGESVPLSSAGSRMLPPTLSLYDMTADLYFHTFDKFYGFGGAMSSVYIGAGRPLHLSGAPGRWNPNTAGIWRLPNGKWLYTPEMNYAMVEGYIEASQIVEAYAWPTSHQTMRSFADLFWAFDEAARDHPIAQKAAKQIRSIGFGWLAMDVRQFRDDPGQGSVGDMYRPDIWGTVVSEMRVKMNYEMNRLWALGYEPLWWNSDELGFFSNDPNPLTAVPIVRRTGMGAFRHRYSLRVDDELLLAFMENREDKAAAFAQCHDLLLRKWEKQQQTWMAQTLMVPAVQHA